jgi:UDPglucose--hexose-1-phosphate uridylyltransferase
MPHRRLNCLTGEWVLVSPHRSRRPWQGAIEAAPHEERPAHDPACSLCPGVVRASGATNPPYEGIFVFDNDFPALLPSQESSDEGEVPPRDDLLVAEAERGACRVICYTPHHDASLASLSFAGRRAVVEAWADQTRGLLAQPSIRNVQVFENRGVLMGASNPHPHGQLWAQEHVPSEVAQEARRQLDHRRARGSCLLCDVLAREVTAGARVLFDEGGWLAIVPFWAAWPFEVLLLPRAHCADLPSLDEGQRDGLARILGSLFAAYDQLFSTPMPLTWGFHQAASPAAGSDGDEERKAFHLHAHFFPPLLRSSTVRKWMVGYELLAEAQRDLSPEAAAQRLREASGA